MTPCGSQRVRKRSLGYLLNPRNTAVTSKTRPSATEIALAQSCEKKGKPNRNGKHCAAHKTKSRLVGHLLSPWVSVNASSKSVLTTLGVSWVVWRLLEPRDRKSTRLNSS